MSNFLDYLKANELTIYEGLTSLAVVDTATNLQNLSSKIDESQTKIKSLEKELDSLSNQLLQISRELDSFEKTTNTNFTLVNTDLSNLNTSFESHVKDYKVFKTLTLSTFSTLDSELEELAEYVSQQQQDIEAIVKISNNLESNLNKLDDLVAKQQTQIQDLTTKTEALTKAIDNLIIEPHQNRFGYLLRNHSRVFASTWIWIVIESPSHKTGDLIKPGDYSGCTITGVGYDYDYYGGTGSISVEDMQYPSAVQKIKAQTDYFSGTLFLNPP